MCQYHRTNYTCGDHIDTKVADCAIKKSGRACNTKRIVKRLESSRRCFECNTPPR